MVTHYLLSTPHFTSRGSGMLSQPVCFGTSVAKGGVHTSKAAQTGLCISAVVVLFVKLVWH